MDKAMHIEFDGPEYKGKPDVIRIFDNLKAENAALRSELQKQKELNTELVKYVEKLFAPMSSIGDFARLQNEGKSLIKKYKES